MTTTKASRGVLLAFGLILCLWVSESTAVAQTSSSRQQSPSTALTAQAESPSDRGQVLTLEDVVRLVESGLSEDLVITAIRKHGRPFDLSVDQLLALKKASVSDRIIRVMVNPQTDSSADPSSSPPLAPSTIEALPPAQVLAEIGFYLVRGDQAVAIPAQSFTTQKVGMFSVLKMATTAGIAKAKQKAVLRGARAAVRTTDKKPQFLFYAPEGFSPTDYLAIQFEVKDDRRESVVGRMGITGASGGFNDKSILQFSSGKIGPRKYRVMFESGLPPGEYCFYPAADVQVSGDSVNASGRLYDFGIDK